MSVRAMPIQRLEQARALSSPFVPAFNSLEAFESECL